MATERRDGSFTSIFPIITTPDLNAALAFYRDLLGGTVAYAFRGPDGEPGYVALDLGTSHIGIGLDPGLADAPSARFSLWAYAEDCDAAVEHLRANGVTIVEEPEDTPWGERMARVLDSDGNHVFIGQRAPDAAADA